MTGYAQYYKNYIEHCRGYSTFLLLLNTELS